MRSASHPAVTCTRRLRGSSDVPRKDLSQSSSRERAVQLVAQLLQCAAARTDLQTTPILLAASASLSAHEGLLQAAKASAALTAAALLAHGRRCRRPQTLGPTLVRSSQLAVAQQRLDVYFEPFWQRLGADETARLGVRQAANVLHAYATLVQAGSVPDIDEQLCRRLAGTVAAERKQRAVEQEVANTLWALGTLGVVPDAQVLATLHTMAARLAPSMKPQEVSNTLLGLAKLGQPVGDALQSGAAGCCPAASWVTQHELRKMWQTASGRSRSWAGVARTRQPCPPWPPCTQPRSSAPRT